MLDELIMEDVSTLEEVSDWLELLQDGESSVIDILDVENDSSGEH